MIQRFTSTRKSKNEIIALLCMKDRIPFHPNLKTQKIMNLSNTKYCNNDSSRVSKLMRVHASQYCEHFSRILLFQHFTVFLPLHSQTALKQLNRDCFIVNLTVTLTFFALIKQNCLWDSEIDKTFCISEEHTQKEHIWLNSESKQQIYVLSLKSKSISTKARKKTMKVQCNLISL